ncbi:hypothetical protein [Staphylococcus xylosus]
MKKNLLYALVFAAVGFIAMGLKHIIVYQSMFQEKFTNQSALDILISTIICYLVGLLFVWGLDLNFKKK